MTAVERMAVHVDATLAELATRGGHDPLPGPPSRDEVAAVLFTSGATGPAKGVVYRHRQLEAQRDAVAAMVGLQPDDRLVAAFAPFALYGPAVGIPSVVPDMDVTAPATLSARALHDAVAAVDATLVFASPAALRNIVATADAVDGRSFGRVRCLLTSGAPIARDTLRAASRLLGGCEAHTPYGMTEVLLVSDITLAELDDAGDGHGVCVGRPVRAVDVAVSPLDGDGQAAGGLTTRADVTGEIVVRAEHVKDHYDQLWVTQQQSVRPHGWHRTGDVGHLDEVGRLWVEGRLVHVVVTADGVVTPVGAEQDLERLDFVRLAAVVGVGPSGCAQVVAVVEAADPVRRTRQASLRELDAMRRAVEPPLAAAFVVPALPVDVRHNSKIDRARVARWAARVLSGERATAL
jgi:acyl-coenzyme A synthetase/AMP-(fatty) acid ligase